MKRTPAAKKPKKEAAKRAVAPRALSSRGLLGDIRKMIDETRSTVAAAVNASLTLLYWRIGRRIQEETLKGKRAEYGEEILATLSQQLTRDYGEGFAYSSLTRMIRFAESFPDGRIVATLSQQLSWSHFREIVGLKGQLEREFYAEMCRVERWSVRALRERIDSMLFERTAISRKPKALAKRELAALRDQGKLAPSLVFRDPYVLDFLGLKDAWSEEDFESAIVREIQRFILEMGVGFAFVARQMRIVIDGEDFHIDLVLYHRRMRRLIAIDLKLSKFKAAYKGQMELYLRWLDRHERLPGEEPPLGLILCAEGSSEQIELLRLDESGIHVAEYLVGLPPKAQLQKKLHEVIVQARERAEGRNPEPAQPIVIARKKARRT